MSLPKILYEEESIRKSEILSSQPAIMHRSLAYKQPKERTVYGFRKLAMNIIIEQ